MEDADNELSVPIESREKTAVSVRDERGRFVNSPGPGRKPGSRPKAQAMAALVEATVDEDRLRGIIRKLADLATAGDIHAASWIFDRLFGRPRQQVEISGGMEIHQNHPASMFDDLVAEVLRDSPQKRAEYAAMGFAVLAADGEEGN